MKPPTMQQKRDTIPTMESFNHHAKTYLATNFLQEHVADELFARCAAQIPPIRSCLDIGCGAGAIYNRIEAARNPLSPHFPFVRCLQNFVGLDSAPNLLALHARSPIVSLVCGDFNRPLGEQIGGSTFDVAFASSSLQWANNLETSLENIAAIASHLAAAIFTARSLHELHTFVGIRSPLLHSATLQTTLEKFFDGSCTKQLYHLRFENLRALLQYIRKSGIRGQTTLSAAQTQRLRHYASNTLVFEVLYFVGTRRN